MGFSSFFTGCLARGVRGLASWKGRLRDVVNRWLVLAGPRVYIAVHWPWPIRRPWQRRKVTFLPPGGGIGDELMCTPVFAAIKQRNPECEITLVTRFPDFFRSHPCIDHVRLETRPPPPGVKLSYHYALPPPRPLVTLVGEGAGLERVRGEVVAPPLRVPEKFARELAALPRPRVAIQPLAGGWTVNKNWPREYWEETVRALTPHAAVYEIGTRALLDEGAFGPAFRSFAGRTSIEEFAWLISQADLFIGPSSGGMHLASAFGVPALIVFGGYEAPEGYPFANIVPLYNPVACAPCWRRDCPFEQKCLRGIEPATVVRRALELLAKRKPETG